MKTHETLPEDIERRVGRSLWNIRASGEGLDDAGYITETFIKKEAWRRYAEERKIELD